jgi:hypothetical protein
VAPNSACLIVVGRQDTGDLEAQVRGSRHAWDIRIISVDALLRLVRLKEDADEATAIKIRELLLPFEYTRVDRIIDLAFTAAKEVTAALGTEEVQLSDDESPHGETKQDRTPREIQEALRNRAVLSMAHDLGTHFVKKSNAAYWSPDKETRLCCALSKKYGEGGYWYGFHERSDEFLAEGSSSFYVLACVGLETYFCLPFSFIHPLLSSLNQTVRPDSAYWHIHLDLDEQGDMKMKLHKTGNSVSIEPYRKSFSVKEPN